MFDPRVTSAELPLKPGSKSPALMTPQQRQLFYVYRIALLDAREGDLKPSLNVRIDLHRCCRATGHLLRTCLYVKAAGAEDKIRFCDAVDSRDESRAGTIISPIMSSDRSPQWIPKNSLTGLLTPGTIAQRIEVVKLDRAMTSR